MSSGYRLVIDTATRQASVAVGEGRVVLAEQLQTTEHRHGSTLLEQVQAALDHGGVSRHGIGAVGVGTGPGSFTGLRVGLAAAKTIAYALDVPIVGIPTGAAIARAVARSTGADEASLAVLLPAGTRDHYLALPGEAPRLLPPSLDPIAEAGGRTLVAVDLPGADLPPEAAELGNAGLRGLTAALLDILDERLEHSERDDVARLVPAYVALPRGIPAPVAEMAWSPDLR